MSELTGNVFAGRYKILEKIGAGGMAIVYLAQDMILERQVAIKILREQFVDDEQNLKHFQNEARAVAAFSHPNIVKIFDVGMENNMYYIVMEFLEGRTLKDMIRKEAPLNMLLAIDIVRGVLRALQHSHEKGIIHRDIKPHNIIITRDGKVKVTDFGIAKNSSASTITYSGQMVGSVYYISPEQAKGYMTTSASDIYSTGVMLYEMLTGSVPFTGDNPVGVALSHVQKEAVPVRQLNRKVPDCLAEVVERAMQKNPKDRYPTAEAMDRALLKARTLMEQGRAGRRVRLNVKQYKKPALVAGLALLALLLVWGGVRMLGSVTRTAEVPEVTGMDLTAAGVLLEEAGYTWRVDRRVNSETEPEGQVLEQDPQAGSRVSRDRTVLLTVSSGPELVKVPSVVGQRERNAVINLKNSGLEAQISEAWADSPLYAAGDVMDQTPGPGEDVPRGTVVELVISKGVEPKPVKVPDLKGLTLSSAESQLRTLGLQVGTISMEASDEYFSGQVASQSVTAGSDLLQGESVNLVISNGPGPASNSQTLIQFTVEAEEEVLITISVDDESGIHEEYRQTHQPGDQVRAAVTYTGSGIITVFQNDNRILETRVP